MVGVAALKELEKDDAEAVAWCVIESLASMDNTASAVVSAIHLLRDCYGADAQTETGIIANPFFLDNGHSGLSPKTVSYLTSRKFKSLGSGGLSLASSLATGVTMVDVAGIAREGSAVGTTAGHMIGIKAAGSRFKNSVTINGWIDAMMKAKAAKLGMRSVGLVGAAVPIPAVGLTVNVVKTLAGLGIKLTLGKLILRVAMEVHWRAYQEVIIGRSTDRAIGPASAMVYELFTKRSFTRILGKYDTNKIIREPGGWMAINDKLMLM